MPIHSVKVSTIITVYFAWVHMGEIYLLIFYEQVLLSLGILEDLGSPVSPSGLTWWYV